MSVGNADSPTGQQWHIRYEPASDPGRLYWSFVYDNEPEAVAALEHYRSDARVLQADLFVRDVTPWRSFHREGGEE